MNVLTTAFCVISAITNIAELAQAVKDNRSGQTFSLNATVILPKSPNSPYLVLEDPTSAFYTYSSFQGMEQAAPHPGDRVKVSGKINSKINDDGIIISNADSERLEVIERGSPRRPVQTTPAKLADGSLDFNMVSLTGVLEDAILEEISHEWYDLTLNCNGETIYVLTRSQLDLSEKLTSLVGAEIEVTGVCHPSSSGIRSLTGRFIQLPDISLIKVRTPPHDRFDAPILDTATTQSPQAISRLGRVRASGEVIAVRGQKLLLRPETGRYVGVELSGSTSPDYGDFVDVVGFVETDTYNFTINRAIWRKAEGRRRQNATCTAIHATDIAPGPEDIPRINPKWHGRPVILSGIVIAASQDGNISLSDQGKIVRIDASALRKRLKKIPAAGSVVRISGICVIEIEKWQSHAPFPRATGFVLVPRAPTDIAVLKNPPWWTPARLLALIGALLAAFLGIMIWNLSLRRLAERRGRALLREEIGHVKATLRLDERTRLAVELHDALSQTLTGVALQVDAAERARQKAPEKVESHLTVARKTLESCRAELRNCLWDLRNHSLEYNDVETAVRHTIEPHIGEAMLSVRFALSRARLSDSTMHTLLRIVRELAVNAIRHGHATEIRVAGSLQDGMLIFSVADNGSGFDPSKSPGIESGHFGLHGIRERIASMDGEVEIKSQPKNGSKVTVSLRVRTDTE